MLAAFDTVRQRLSLLIDPTPEQRRPLPKMGDESRAFVAKALAVAQRNSNFLPRSFSVEEVKRDVALLESLLPTLVALTRLQEQLQDTYAGAGSGAYAPALVV